MMRITALRLLFVMLLFPGCLVAVDVGTDDSGILTSQTGGGGGRGSGDAGQDGGVATPDGGDTGFDAGLPVTFDAGPGGLEAFCAEWRGDGGRIPPPGCPTLGVPEHFSAEGFRMLDKDDNIIGIAPAGSICIKNTTVCHPCSSCNTVNAYYLIDPQLRVKPCTCVFE